MRLKIVVIAAMVMFACMEARADSPITQDIKLGNGTQAGAAAGAWSDSNATGGSGYGGMGGSGGAGGIGGVGIGGSGGTASNSGNAQSVNFDQVRQAPAVFMNAPMPTSPCQATAGGFLSMFIFGGAGVSGSYTLEQCEIREEARSLVGMGRSDLALKVMCMAKYSSRLQECKTND